MNTTPQTSSAQSWPDDISRLVHKAHVERSEAARAIFGALFSALWRNLRKARPQDAPRLRPGSTAISPKLTFRHSGAGCA